jgi:hypothetical protein
MEAKAEKTAAAAVTLTTKTAISLAPLPLIFSSTPSKGRKAWGASGAKKSRGAETTAAQTAAKATTLTHVEKGEWVSKTSMTLKAKSKAGSITLELKAAVPVRIKAESTATVGWKGLVFLSRFSRLTTSARLSRKLWVRLLNFDVAPPIC